MDKRTTIEIIPTCVPKNPRELASALQVIRGFSHKIHIDTDDGVFTPALTWPYVKAGVFEDVTLEAMAGMDVEVHLMVKDPLQIGSAFARAGAFRIIGHIESFPNSTAALDALETWRKVGALEVGLAILLDTPLEALNPVIQSCDVVQVMSIATVGWQGAQFDERAITRVRELHEKHPSRTIMCDGGVSSSTIAPLIEAGARRFAVGSAIMNEDDPSAAFIRLSELAGSAVPV